MHGFGNLTWKEGEIYIGQLEYDKFHGQGKYQWRDGKIYIGGWF